MKVDTIKAFATYTFAFTVLIMAFYGLVIYDYALDPLVQGALIAWGGAAMAFVFGQEIAKASTAAVQRSYDKGLATPTPPTTTTVTSEGPPATSTTTTVGAVPEGEG
jgi:hypothetical protein